MASVTGSQVRALYKDMRTSGLDIFKKEDIQSYISTAGKYTEVAKYIVDRPTVVKLCVGHIS